jgi:hypothetical protein
MTAVTIPPELAALVDVYPVGVLRDLQAVPRYLRHRMPSRAWACFRSAWRHPARHIRNGDWRAFGNTFSGYLAEPGWLPGGFLPDDPWPRWARCGHGWTRRRALRDLARHLQEANR